MGIDVEIGSDGISGEEPFATARDEALCLHQHAFADNLALLKMWSETTVWTIFPQRRISQLDEGYEASLLVLDGDPIEDFRNVTRISRPVNQGVEL